MEQMADLFKPVTLPAQPGQPQKLAPIIIALQELALVHHQRNACATSGCIVGYGNENGQCSNDAICCEPNGIITTPCATPCNVCVVNGDVECTPDFDGAKIVQGACNIGSTCCGGMPTTEFAAGVVLCSKSTNKYWNISSYIPGSVLGPGCKNLSGGTVMLTTGTTTGCPSGTKAYRVVNYYNATLNDDACNFGSDIASGCVRNYSSLE